MVKLHKLRYAHISLSNNMPLQRYKLLYNKAKYNVILFHQTHKM